MQMRVIEPGHARQMQTVTQIISSSLVDSGMQLRSLSSGTNVESASEWKGLNNQKQQHNSPLPSVFMTRNTEYYKHKIH